MDISRAQEISDLLHEIKYQEGKVRLAQHQHDVFIKGEQDVTLTLSWQKLGKDGKTVNYSNRERRNLDVGKEIITALVLAELNDEKKILADLSKKMEAI